MTVESVNFTDTLTLDAPRRTGEHGYLAATAYVARTGIQTYRGWEVGRPDLDKVRVYRPEDEVFSEDTMKSFAHRPVTNSHPPVPVTSENWKKYAVGQVGDEVVRDGHRVKVPILLMDAEMIRDYESGKKQISQGYSCDLKWESGKTPGGETYDAIQTNIRGNHTAVVDAARGGPDIRIVDNHKELNMKTITVDGLPVQVEDRDSEIVLRTIKKLDDQITTLTADAKRTADASAASLTELTKKLSDSTALVGTRDAEIVTLKKQIEDAKLTPAKLDALVKDRADVVTRAKAILGDKLVVDGKTEPEIRRQVVDAAMGDDAKGWTDDQVAASFNVLAKKQANGDQLRDALSAPLVTNSGASDELEKAYATRDKNLEDAWKTKAA